MWLDRGELDKLIDRGVQSQPAQAAQATWPTQAPRQPDFEDSDFSRKSQYGYRKQKSWLSDIFD